MIVPSDDGKHMLLRPKNLTFSCSHLPVGWLLIGVGAALAVGVLAVVVPLRLGIRALRTMEF